MIIFLEVSPICQSKNDLLTKFLMNMSNLLPETPQKFHLNYLFDKIDSSVAWGFGFLVKDMLSGISEYVVIVVSWKMLKLVLSTFASKFL